MSRSLLFLLVPTLALAASSARAETATPIEHRLALTASFSPLAPLSSMGGDGHARDAKDAFAFGVEASYALRPVRYLQIGAGAGYHAFHDRESKYPIDAHELEGALEAAFVFPVTKRVEVLAGGRGGLAHIWMLHQNYLESGTTLRAFGPMFGPRLGAFYAIATQLDLACLVGVDLYFTSATNGASYLKDVPVWAMYTPILLGVRGRFQ